MERLWDGSRVLRVLLTISSAWATTFLGKRDVIASFVVSSLTGFFFRGIGGSSDGDD